MKEQQYGYTVDLGVMEFEEAIGNVTEALKEQGFGVITEIDVKKTVKTKLDIDFRPYRILGACNPKLAHSAIEAEPLIGLLLPCNVVVQQAADGTVEVAVVKPIEMLSVVRRPEMQQLASEVDDKVRKVLSALEA
jgi:uncharacterized protein (DUF302 family)